MIPTKVFYSIFVATLLLSSCNSVEQKTPTISNIPASVVDSCDIEMKVSTALVCSTAAYGYVGVGSALFNMNDSEHGYRLQLLKCQKVLLTRFCPKDVLQKYIADMKYELLITDSTVLKD